MSRRVSKAAVAAGFLAFALSGCLGRSVIEVRAPVSSAPQGTAFVKITEIRDLRQFEVSPDRPSSPSLAEAADIANPAVVVRAVGRKRNGYGGGAGDVLLPEGSTVGDLVRDTARKALQDKGYLLVDENSPNSTDASPLAIVIDRFWAWTVPAGQGATIYFNAALVMKGDAVADGNGSLLEIQTAKYSPFPTDGTWRATIEQGLAELDGKMEARLKAPSPR